MNYTLQIDNEYIPEAYGNKDLPSDEQYSVVWTWPSADDKQKCRKMRVTSSEEVILDIDYGLLVKKCIKKIVRFNFNGNPIRTGLDLWNQNGLSELADEMSTFLMEKLKPAEEESEEIAEKN